VAEERQALRRGSSEAGRQPVAEVIETDLEEVMLGQGLRLNVGRPHTAGRLNLVVHVALAAKHVLERIESLTHGVQVILECRQVLAHLF
jgi:hypothetical protein